MMTWKKKLNSPSQTGETKNIHDKSEIIIFGGNDKCESSFAEGKHGGMKHTHISHFHQVLPKENPTYLVKNSPWWTCRRSARKYRTPPSNGENRNRLLLDLHIVPTDSFTLRITVNHSLLWFILIRVSHTFFGKGFKLDATKLWLGELWKKRQSGGWMVYELMLLTLFSAFSLTLFNYQLPRVLLQGQLAHWTSTLSSCLRDKAFKCYLPQDEGAEWFGVIEFPQTSIPGLNGHVHQTTVLP